MPKKMNKCRRSFLLSFSFTLLLYFIRCFHLFVSLSICLFLSFRSCVSCLFGIARLHHFMAPVSGADESFSVAVRTFIFRLVMTLLTNQFVPFVSSTDLYTDTQQKNALFAMQKCNFYCPSCRRHQNYF